MIKEELIVEGMSCGHCVAAVERLVNNIEGVVSAEINLPNNAKVEFEVTKTSLEDIKKMINDSEIYKTV